MNRFDLEELLKKINGCSFASLDCVTEPSPGIRKETTGKRVILFTNKNTNGYQNMVRRRLLEAGKDPDSFALGDRRWGERLPNSPLVEHKGVLHLEVIELTPGATRCFIGTREVDCANLGLRKGRAPNQGLPSDQTVKVRDIKLENITRIALMGEVLVMELPEALLA